MSEERKNVRMKAKRAFSGGQTSATYLGRIEEHETFEATEYDASYLERNGFAERVVEETVTPDATIERDEREATSTPDAT